MMHCALILIISCMEVCGCVCLTPKAPRTRKITSLSVGGNDVDAVPSPTPDDELLEEWYTEQGVLGINRVKVRTSTRSVAGRGLFYSSSHSAQQGDMLALIPHHLVLTERNAQLKWPGLKENNNDNSLDWPVSLTIYAQQALQNQHDAWRPWIETWIGPSAPQPPDSFSTNEIKELAAQAQSTPTEIKKALQARYDIFEKDAHRFSNHDLYAIVLSRVANLGPAWNRESGVIPLHDMLNHPPVSVEPNVELFSIADIVSLTSDEYVASRAKAKFSLDQRPNDLDLVLVARKPIHPGQELFLAYAKRDLTEEERVWKMLQYGFSLTA